MLSAEGTLSRKISDATLAIFFFGALHRETQSQSWERQLTSLLSVSQRDVRSLFPLLSAIAIGQHSVAQNFLSLAVAYAVFNIYEDSDTPVSKEP